MTLIKKASQEELREYFGHFGHVKDARIITDPRGNSRGYGFVTYESENDASKVLSVKEEDLIFKEGKLNIGHAYRKKNNFPNQQNNNGFNNNILGGMNGLGGGGGNLGMGGLGMGGLGMNMGMNNGGQMGGLGNIMGHNMNSLGQNGNSGINHHLSNNPFMDQGQMGGMHHMGGGGGGGVGGGMNSIGGGGQMHQQMNLHGMNGFGGMGGLNGMNMN